MKRLLALMLFALLTPATASAQQWEPALITNFGDSGDPTVYADLVSPGGVIEYRVCPPDGTPCRPLPRLRGLGPTPAGTTFEADIERNGTVTTLRTPPWQGRVTAAAPPAITGGAQVGATPSGQPGTWTGGWGRRTVANRGTIDDTTWTLTVVCRTPAREDCWAPESGPLAQRWAGWYLVAHEQRWSDVCPVALCPVALTAVPPPGPWPAPLPIGQTIASSAPVQICCTLPAPAADPVPAPTASIRTRATRAKGRLRVGRVECTIRCSVGLTVAGGGRTYTHTFSVEGPATVTSPLRHGRLRVQIKIDGKVIARGRTVAR